MKTKNIDIESLLEEPVSEYYSSYQQLDVWIESRKLVNSIYDLTKNFPKEELYGLTSQMRRSAVSVLSNIAEGCGRNYSKESIQFLFIARGSVYELETQIIISSDQNMISKIAFENIQIMISNSKKLLNGFIRYYESKSSK